ncbi:calcium-binding protein [Paucibacter sp. KBW04]|uniref:excalibur calcium-binding domain-containing protein n=1 Tax=Paucibacter sp. KBW04 TaxID=2153361 RepID=UPI000F578DBE|nr:excalibur calcium-binding domain-containing protein [Paucibacter sp. KBW04]RQO59823.1 calcium-binding protein [Paucibacter sp. KBW04]
MTPALPSLRLLSLLFCSLALLTTPATAQVRKCEIDGKTVYQQTPCPVTGPIERPTAQQLNAQRKEAAPRSHDAASRAPIAAKESPSAKSPEATTQSRVLSARCDGRTHCSQMSSCEEAKFFLANCPGVEMDGDGDGKPCEKQWCKW